MQLLVLYILSRSISTLVHLRQLQMDKSRRTPNLLAFLSTLASVSEDIGAMLCLISILTKHMFPYIKFSL